MRVWEALISTLILLVLLQVSFWFCLSIFELDFICLAIPDGLLHVLYISGSNIQGVVVLPLFMCIIPVIYTFHSHNYAPGIVVLYSHRYYMEILSDLLTINAMCFVGNSGAKN